MTSFLLGINPLNAVYINIIISTLTIPLVFKISRNIKLTALSAFMICSALLLYKPYTNEVLSGRSMPLAIFTFLIGFYFFQKSSLFLAGLFFGMSALVRFDFLVYAIVFQLILFAINKIKINKFFFLLFGFISGIIPWVIYSYIHFNKFWISDNSWVAISALPAYVVDYPAFPIISAFQDPNLWLTKITGNAIPLFKSIIKSIIYYPVLIVYLLIAIANLTKFSSEIKYKFIIFFIAGIISVMPYMLTGYFDARYFALIFFASSMLLIYTLISNDNLNYLGLTFNSLAFTMICVTLIFGFSSLFKDFLIAKNKFPNLHNQENQISDLYSCHILNSKNTYIFTNDAMRLAPRYGAITGMPTAFIPSNFDRMTDIEKTGYFEFMQPFVLIDNLNNIKKCSNH